MKHRFVKKPAARAQPQEKAVARDTASLGAAKRIYSAAYHAAKRAAANRGLDPDLAAEEGRIAGRAALQ